MTMFLVKIPELHYSLRYVEAPEGSSEDHIIHLAHEVIEHSVEYEQVLDDHITHVSKLDS